MNFISWTSPFEIESSIEKRERQKILSFFSKSRGIENEIYLRFGKRKEKMEEKYLFVVEKKSQNYICMYSYLALKKISVMHVIKLGFAPVSFPPG